MRNTIFIFGMALLMAGVVLAIGGATFTPNGDPTRWTGMSPDNDTTEGGNITDGDITGTSLTDRWAGYYGNVSGNIVLWNGTFTMFNWTVSLDNIVGEVCTSTNSSFDFSAPGVATAAGLDSAWGFGDVPDNATNTFLNSGCDLAFAQSSVANTIYANHDNSAFRTCAINDNVGSGEGNFAFCSVINATGVAYNTVPAHYELMVPTTAGTGTETYYFYLELS